MPTSADTSIEIAAGDADAGLRLDRLLAVRIDELSRSRIQALIRNGAVTRAGATIGDPGTRVKPGDVYVLIVPPPEPAEPAGETIALDIVYEDAALIVIDKPPGLVVHPGAGHATGTLVNALIAHCGASLSGIGGVARPGIVHRLDKDTSGLLVVAKNDRAHQSLAEQFAAHGRDGRLERRYLALVWGAMARPSGTIDVPLARSASNRTKIAPATGAGGRPAVTHWRVARIFRDAEGRPLASLLEVELETGRTHQIRVHMAQAGHPVLGDPVYGAGFKTRAAKLPEPAAAALAALRRQALHAAVLGFVHPTSGRQMRFERPPPDDMARLLAALAGDGDTKPAQNQPLRRK